MKRPGRSTRHCAMAACALALAACGGAPGEERLESQVLLPAAAAFMPGQGGELLDRQLERPPPGVLSGSHRVSVRQLMDRQSKPVGARPGRRERGGFMGRPCAATLRQALDSDGTRWVQPHTNRHRVVLREAEHALKSPFVQRAPLPVVEARLVEVALGLGGGGVEPDHGLDGEAPPARGIRPGGET